MAWDIERKKLGNRPFQFAEFDMDFCDQDYGRSPCLPLVVRKYYEDTFTDVDGTLLQNHTEGGFSWVKTNWSDMPIIGNKISFADYTVDAEYFCTTLFSPDVEEIYINVNLPDPQSDVDEIHFYVRSTGVTGNSSIDSNYEIRFVDFGNAQQWLIYRNDFPNANDALLESIYITNPSEFTRGIVEIKIALDTYDIKVYANGSLKIQTSDNAIPTGGYFGFYAIGHGGAIPSPLTVDGFRVYSGESDTSDLSNACYNTNPNCQFLKAYSKGVKTYRFYKGAPDVPFLELGGYSCMQSIDVDPPMITPSEGLGSFAELTLVMENFPHHDRGTDPYVESRNYDPESQGTFWGKWLARNKYYTGRIVRLYSGYLVIQDDSPYSLFDIANFQVREYRIERIDGPDKNGRVKITCMDVLKELDNAMMPLPSKVFTTSAIDANVTTIPITSDGDLALPIILEDGQSSHMALVGDNIEVILENGAPTLIPLSAGMALPIRLEDGSWSEIAMTSTQFIVGERVTFAIGKELMNGIYSPNQITDVIRNYGGSDADAHEAGETVQYCVDLTGKKVTEALRIAFEFAKIDSSINDITWAEQQSKWLDLITMDGIITKPTKAKDVVAKLCIEGTVYIWSDVRTNKVELKAIAPQVSNSALKTLTDQFNFIEDSIDVKRDMAKQITRVILNFDKVNQIEDNKPENMASTYTSPDFNAESANQWNRIKAKEINCQFVRSAGHAATIATRTLGRLRDGTFAIPFKLADKDSDLWMGDEFLAETPSISSASGAPDVVRMQVIKVEQLEGGEYAYLAQKSDFQGRRYARIAPNTMGKYSTASQADQDYYAFISNANGYMSDGTLGALII